MKMLDDYSKLQAEIYEYFGYEEDWRVLPIDDARGHFWELDEDQVRFSETTEALEDEEAGQHYSNEIYKQRHLPKWVYEGKEYTMIVVDTHTDGNQFLQIFENSKKVN